MRAVRRAAISAVLIVAACEGSLADSVDEFVSQQMAKRHIPGAVLIALRNGEIVKEQAYGNANVELNIAMRTDYVFPVASITKVFVATAVFLLVQDGRLSLKDKVTELIPGLPEAWRGITVLNCLSHTSGIPDIVKYRPGGFQWLGSSQ